MPEVGSGRGPDQLSPDEALAERVRVAAFALLLRTPRAIEVADIASAAGLNEIGRILDALADAGQIDRDPQGRVTGAVGLSLDHGPHALKIGGHPYRTWCAYDALGKIGRAHV